VRICFAQQFHLAERMGGAEVQAWLLAVELARRGHEVSYIAESLTGRAGNSELRDGVRIHWLPRQLYVELPNMGPYHRLLRRIDPELVIQRSTSMYTAVAGWFARRRQRPFIWICTDDSIPYRWYFVRQQLDMSKRYGGNPAKRLALLAIAMLRDVAKNFGIRRATHPATQNARQAEALRREFGLDSHHFHSGHPLPGVLEPKDVEPLVLWVGDVSHRKRPELFVDLATACRDLPLRFAMICKKASGKDEARWNALAAHARENPRFAWLGARTLEETNRWFERAAIYVSTSAPGGDGFPNTFVQAWLRRTPVLTFGTDPDQLVARHELGRVVATVQEARAALLELALTPELALAGARVETFARDRHSIESVADRTLALVAAELEPVLLRSREYRELRAENERLRRLVSDLSLEKQQLRELLARGLPEREGA
jgi:glycosyltransferase involved in cell wall biosynthesis